MQNAKFPQKTVAIVGVGLIGGSLALALKKLPEISKVIGVGRNRASIDRALALNVIDEGYVDIAQGVREADLVWVAVPVGSIVEVIQQAIPHLLPGAIITDMGSTKASIVRGAEDILPPHLHFIGGHPIAGSEKQGVEAASPELFKGSVYLLTPTTRTNTEAFQLVHSLVTQIGAHVLAIDPDKHDEAMATISHLPHLVSAVLVNLAGERIRLGENILRLAGGSFKDMTRIAASSPEIWLDIAIENREAILRVITEFQEELEQVKKMIDLRDRKELIGKLTLAREIRQSLPAIFPTDLSELRELSIPVVDRRGVISDITLIVGELGINIEDIELVHSPDHRSAVLGLVIIGREGAEKAKEALSRKGYQVEIKAVYSEEALKKLRGTE